MIGRHRRRHGLRGRADPDLFGTVTDLAPIAEAAHAAGALLIVVTTEAVSLGLLKSPGEMGADIAVAEGQSIGNAPQFRRPLCRPVRHPRETCAPDAGPACRRDGRRRGPARLRADAVDPRAAHPPREGDQQHLHQFRPVRAGLHHPHDAAGRGGAATAGARSTTPTRVDLAGRAGRDSGRQRAQRRVSSTSSRSACRARPPNVVEALAGRGIIAGVPVSRLAPDAGLDDLCSSPPPKSIPPRTAPPSPRALRRVAVTAAMNAIWRRP